MKGITRTQKEIEFHDRVAQLGCISCRQEGNYNPWVSIHHAHGRTKPGCHMWVLPLCEPHHQDNGTAIARHPYKRRWEAKYGNEDDLIREMWTELGVEFTDPVRVAKPVDRSRPKKSTPVSTGVVQLREIKEKVEKPLKAKIPSARPVQSRVKVAKPAAPKQKILKPDRRTSKDMPKAKIQNASKIPKAAKQPRTEQQKKFIEERKAAQKLSKPKPSQEDKSKLKLAAKTRREKYIEDNKDYIQSRRELAKLAKKDFLNKISVNKTNLQS